MYVRSIFSSILLLAILQGFDESFIVEKMDYLMEWLQAPELASKSNFVFKLLYVSFVYPQSFVHL